MSEVEAEQDYESQQVFKNWSKSLPNANNSVENYSTKKH